MRQCAGWMTLPPQSEGVRIQCELQPSHDGLHCATDEQGTVRRWPDSGVAHDTAVSS